jgi:hypothetical protein
MFCYSVRDAASKFRTINGKLTLTANDSVHSQQQLRIVLSRNGAVLHYISVTPPGSGSSAFGR